MELNVQRVFRKSFAADSVRVTEQNISAVAGWCSGTITIDRGPNGHKQRIEFPIHGFKGNQTKGRAYLGDWVVYREVGFMVYKNESYLSTFESREAS
jgi:hypothetical protein